MSKKVSVLLLECVAGLGDAGDIVSVAEGFARNALFPGGKAALASAADMAAKRERAAVFMQKNRIEIEQARKKAEQLEGTELTLNAKVKEGSEIFGSIRAQDIADALTMQTKLTFLPRHVRLSKTISQLGTYPVTVELSPDVECTIYVVVASDTSKDKPEHD